MPPMAQTGCVGPDSRICVRRLHLLGHHVKVPDRCPASSAVVCNVVNSDCLLNAACCFIQCCLFV